MIDVDTKPHAEPLANDSEVSEEGSLDDMLQELRILLQGAQVLTAFLIVLPFNQGFDKIHDFEKWVYTATFLCSMPIRLPQVCLSWHNLTHARLPQDTHGVPTSQYV